VAQVPYPWPKYPDLGRKNFARLAFCPDNVSHTLLALMCLKVESFEDTEQEAYPAPGIVVVYAPLGFMLWACALARFPAAGHTRVTVPDMHRARPYLPGPDAAL